MAYFSGYPSHNWRLASDIWYLTIHVSYLRCVTSSDISRLTSEVWRLTSNVTSYLSGLRPDIWCFASQISCLTFNVSRLRDEIDILFFMSYVSNLAFHTFLSIFDSLIVSKLRRERERENERFTVKVASHQTSPKSLQASHRYSVISDFFDS